VGYATAQAHSSIEKGLRIAGIGSDNLRLVAVDATFAMRTDALAAAVRADRDAGLVPFFVNATAGTTSSLAFDPVPAIAEVCRRRACGCTSTRPWPACRARPEHRWVNAGVERADSYCTNPHKWMGINFDCDLFYRGRPLGAAGRTVDPARVPAHGGATPALSSTTATGRSRSVAGSAPSRCGSRSCRRPRAGPGHDPPPGGVGGRAGRVGRRRRPLRARRAAALNLVCLRHVDGDAATDALVDAANASGAALFTRTVLDGHSALRVCIGGRTTERRHVEAAWALLQSLA
jgi:aromatic-L-amino-acid decarboxylase